MNQLLIALLISTSLAGVIQGGFVSSPHNEQSQVVKQVSSPAVSKAIKDDLNDFIYINKPVTETSSAIVHNNETEGPVTHISKDVSQKNEMSTVHRTADTNKKADKKGIANPEKHKEKSKDDVSIQTSKENTRKTDKTVGETKQKTNAVKTESEQASTNEETAKAKENEQVKMDQEPKTEVNAVNENSEREGDTLVVKATAYTANCEGGSGVTYTGIDLKANPDSKVIAVDPSVIPLGTEVYVEGYGYAIAADIGGAIKGNKIDVFIPSESAAEDWGIKTVKVKILENQ